MNKILVSKGSVSEGYILPPLSNEGVCDSFADIMVKFAVREVAEKAGITSARALAKASGLHYESCRLLWNGESKMISLDTINQLCQALEVRPAQLFDYEPDSFAADKEAKKKETPGKKGKR